MGKSKSKTKKQTHKKQKRQSYKVRKLNQLKHATNKLRSRFSKHRRTHKRKRGKAKGFFFRKKKRRSRSDIEKNEINEMLTTGSIGKAALKRHIDIQLINGVGHTEKFKQFIKKKKKDNPKIFDLFGKHGISHQFDIDKTRNYYKILDDSTHIEKKKIIDLYKEHISSLPTTNQLSQLKANVLFWGTQGLGNTIFEYIYLLMKQHKYHLTPVDPKYIKSCIEYNETKITAIFDFKFVPDDKIGEQLPEDLIGTEEDYNVYLSCKINITPPFSITDIEDISFSDTIGRCQSELHFKKKPQKRTSLRSIRRHSITRKKH